MANLTLSQARNRTFLMVDSTTHINGLTGATVTVTISKNGAGFAAPAGSVSEVGSGWYKIALTAVDTNTLGDLDYHCTATSADPTDFQDVVTAVDFTDSVRLGLTALPNVTAGAANGLPLVGNQIPNAAAAATGGLQINGVNNGTTSYAALTVVGALTANLTGNVSGTVGSVAGNVTGNVVGDVQGKLLGGGASTIGGAGAQMVLSQAQADLVWQSTYIASDKGTAQSGTAGTIVLRAGASALDNIYNGSRVAIYGGTGFGQCRVIKSYVGATKTATIDTNWIVNPDSTSTYAVYCDEAPALNATQQVQSSLVSGDVQGNVAGNVNGNVNGKLLGQGATALSAVGALTDCRFWNGNQVATPNVSGVPKVDVVDWLGLQPANLIASNVPANLQASASNITVNFTGNLSGSVGTVAGSVASVAAPVTVGTNNDKTGYALSGGEHTNITGDILNATAANFNAAGSIGNKINAAASAGDPWTASLPGAYPSGSAGNIVGNRLDVLVSSRLAAGNVVVSGYASGQDPATLLLDVSAAGHNTAGTIGNKINAAASAGDPWTTALPGSYAPGSAGNIVGSRIDAAITSRMAAATLPSNFMALSIDSSGRVSLQPSGLDNIVIEAGVNGRQALSVCSAAMAGVLSGATGTNIQIQAANNPNINRISAVVDANGDRTSVALSLP